MTFSERDLTELAQTCVLSRLLTFSLKVYSKNYEPYLTTSMS